MKNLIYLFTILLISACGANGTDETLPEDYKSLQNLRHEKRLAIRELEADIAEIEEKMTLLDTGRVGARKIVTTIPVKRGEFNSYKRIQGSVEAEDVVSVTSEIGGRITRLLIKEGQHVKRGQLVAMLDMESVQKQIDEVDKQLELARMVYERQSRLWEQEIGSEIQYLEAKNHVERLEKSIASINSQLEKSKLHAPITGVVDVLHLQSGETAVPGMPIATILSTNDLKIVADAPENLLGKIKKGDQVRIIFPSIQIEMDSRITSLGRKIDPANRTLEMEVAIPKNNSLIKPNLLAEVIVNDVNLRDTLVVPVELVQQEVDGRNFVMINQESEDGPIAAKKYVETGLTYEGDIVIQSGLTGNETLIMEGARGLSEGEHLEIVEQTQFAQDGEEE